MLVVVLLWCATLCIFVMALQNLNEIACNYESLISVSMHDVGNLIEELKNINANAKAIRAMFGDSSAVVQEVHANNMHMHSDSDDNDSELDELEIVDDNRA